MFDFGIEAVTRYAKSIAYYEGGIFLVEFRDYSTRLVINDAECDEVYVFEPEGRRTKNAARNKNSRLQLLQLDEPCRD